MIIKNTCNNRINNTVVTWCMYHCLHIHIYLHIHIHIRTRLYIYICIYTKIYIYIHLPISTSISTKTIIYVYIYTYTHIHIYIYIHIQSYTHNYKQTFTYVYTHIYHLSNTHRPCPTGVERLLSFKQMILSFLRVYASWDGKCVTWKVILLIGGFPGIFPCPPLKRHAMPDLGPGSSPFAAEHRGWSWRDEPGPCRGAAMDSERGQGRAEWPPLCVFYRGD
jgi:hypothetical protein